MVELKRRRRKEEEKSYRLRPWTALNDRIEHSELKPSTVGIYRTQPAITHRGVHRRTNHSGRYSRHDKLAFLLKRKLEFLTVHTLKSLYPPVVSFTRTACAVWSHTKMLHTLSKTAQNGEKGKKPITSMFLKIIYGVNACYVTGH